MSGGAEDVVGVEVKVFDCPGKVLHRSVCAACVGLSELDGTGESQGKEEGEGWKMHFRRG